MKGILKAYNSDKKVFVADSFEGLPPPDPKYPADRGDTHHTIKILAVSLEEVNQNFKKYDLLDENVVFIKGFFEHTIPNAPVDKLSILRLDGDMYSSTIQVLESLYHKVSVGGYIIVDDWCLHNCRKAVNDFRERRNITDEIINIDGIGVFWKKT
jgi:O-methyltransferase